MNVFQVTRSLVYPSLFSSRDSTRSDFSLLISGEEGRKEGREVKTRILADHREDFFAAKQSS